MEITLRGAKLRERALDLLSRRDHSKTELSRKLFQKGGDRDEIHGLMLEFVKLGFLDDRRFAESFVRYRAGKAWGGGRYRQELAKRGISSEVISEILQTSPEISETVLNEKLSYLIERETQKGKPADKIVASLARKGFSLHAIRRALGEFRR